MPARPERPPEARTASKIISCIECRRIWIDPRERWRVLVAMGEDPEIGAYCPECAAREFGARRTYPDPRPRGR